MQSSAIESELPPAIESALAKASEGVRMLTGIFDVPRAAAGGVGGAAPEVAGLAVAKAHIVSAERAGRGVGFDGPEGGALFFDARGLRHLVELASAGVVVAREETPAEDERLELDDVHEDIGVEALVSCGVSEKLRLHGAGISSGRGFRIRPHAAGRPALYHKVCACCKAPGGSFECDRQQSIAEQAPGRPRAGLLERGSARLPGRTPANLKESFTGEGFAAAPDLHANHKENSDG